MLHQLSRACRELVVQKYQLRTKRRKPGKEGDGSQRGMELEAGEGEMEVREGREEDRKERTG